MKMIAAFANQISRILSPCPASSIKDDRFSWLLNADLGVDTKSFFDLNFFIALNAPDPQAVLDRFSVQTITLLKPYDPSQEEYLCVEISDTLRNQSLQLVIIRRTNNRYLGHRNIEDFTQHPESGKVLAAITSALEPSELISSSASTPSSHQPSIDTMRTRSSSQIEATPRHTEDMIFGENLIRMYRYQHGRAVRQIKPKDLNLLQLALLVYVVHTHDPLFFLLKNLYSNLIFDAVLSLYPCGYGGDNNLILTRDQVCLPPNHYLPKLAGQWMEVERVVLSVILNSFSELREQHMSEVSSCVNPGSELIVINSQQISNEVQKRRARREDEKRRQCLKEEVQRLEEEVQRLEEEGQCSEKEGQRFEEKRQRLEELLGLYEELISRTGLLQKSESNGTA